MKSKIKKHRLENVITRTRIATNAIRSRSMKMMMMKIVHIVQVINIASIQMIHAYARHTARRNQATH